MADSCDESQVIKRELLKLPDAGKPAVIYGGYLLVRTLDEAGQREKSVLSLVAATSASFGFDRQQQRRVSLRPECIKAAIRTCLPSFHEVAVNQHEAVFDLSSVIIPQPLPDYFQIDRLAMEELLNLAISLASREAAGASEVIYGIGGMVTFVIEESRNNGSKAGSTTEFPTSCHLTNKQV